MDWASRGWEWDLMRTHIVDNRSGRAVDMGMFYRGGHKNPFKRSTTLLLIVLVFQIILCLGYGAQKTNMHMDEAFTFAAVHFVPDKVLPEEGKAYNSGEPFYSWLSEDDFLDINVGRIYESTYGDPHPPLYYYLFACMYSLAPGSVSPMPGIILNTIFLALTTTLLFLIARRLSLNQIESAAASALWAWSAGMVGDAMFLRMYSLQTFACMLSVYVVVCFFQKNMPQQEYKGSRGLLPEKGTGFLLIGIVFITLFGFFTHYYFAVFAGILYLSVGIIMICRHRIKQALWFGLSAIIGFGAAIAIYPQAITDIFVGFRGAEAISAAKAISWDTFGERVTGYLDIFARDFFANSPKVGAIIILAAIICMVLLIRKRKVLKLSGVSLDPLLFVSITAIAYLLVVSNVSPYITDRYAFAIYPLVGLLIFTPVLLLRIVIKKHGPYKYAPLGLTFIGIILAFSLFTPTVRYLDAYDNPELDSAWENKTAITISLYRRHFSLASYYMGNEKNIFYYTSAEDPINEIGLPDDEQSMTLCIETGFVDDALLEKLQIDENVNITKVGTVGFFEIFDVDRLDSVDTN
jgi:hypothetical protein